MSGAAGAAASNRGEQDRMNVSRDSLRIGETANAERARMERGVLDLRQRDEARTEQDDAYKMAIRAALAKNMRDASFSRPEGIPNISFSGGARPSALGVEGRDAAALMSNLAMRRLMEPKPMADLPPIERVKLSDPSEASIWEKLAGPIGMGLTVASTGLDNQNRPVVVPPNQNPTAGAQLPADWRARLGTIQQPARPGPMLTEPETPYF
jgi:hypothetical protein